MNRVRGEGGRFHTIKEEGERIYVKQEIDVSSVKSELDKSRLKDKSPPKAGSPVSVEIFLGSHNHLTH